EKVYFYQGDHLGSAQLITDDQGTVYQHLEYFPSGEIWVDERSESQRTPYLFSGKELDEETGLSYFGYRYYEARQGQWISADPILDEMLDLEKLTSASLEEGPFFLPGLIYGYVGNHPTNLIDPEGLGKGKIGMGGRHGQTKKYSQKGLVESNHFPAANVYKDTPYAGISREHMPAVTMPYDAHRNAASTGSSHRARDWREKHRKYLRKRQFHRAMREDIQNMHYVVLKKDWKPVKQGIKQAISFAERVKLIKAEFARDLQKYTDSLK
ncbi:MAG TPA: RHS repeat-associated core domain-containing protein, partial [Thermoanaerobaculia bacterium]|nr:RHS repeat-associated core domain-containing protein [Thermoanaerobaculia bacterium]